MRQPHPPSLPIHTNIFFYHIYVLTYLNIHRPHRTHTRNPQDKTDRVQNIRLPTAIQPRDRIEALVPAADHRAHGVRLEAVQD